MVNKHKGEIKINIGGRNRILKLTLNDFAELQDRYDGKPLMDILAQLDNIDMKLIRALLYIGLRHDDPDLTEEQVGNFEMNIVEATQALGDCISLSLGAEPDEKK